ncbi:glucosaminidase domain-containing protein [Clostridium sp. B9]|uniref:N-acetylmuramoyl-L-alanine amidase family protein n=1 Tax=Clostridium sp. B9 TaxID=3423224 RepID=UPI003D2ECBE2
MIRKTSAILAIVIALSTTNVFATDAKVDINAVDNKQEKSIDNYNEKVSGDNTSDKVNDNKSIIQDESKDKEKNMDKLSGDKKELEDKTEDDTKKKTDEKNSNIDVNSTSNSSEKKESVKEEDNSKKIEAENKDNLVGSVYEKKDIKAAPKAYQFFSVNNDGKELKYEQIRDSNGLESLVRLQPKTEKKYEVALAKDDGSFVYLGSYDDYIAAKDSTEHKNSNIQSFAVTEGMPVVLNDQGKVIYAEKALGRVVGISGQSTINICTDSSLNDAFTYIAASYIDDVPIIKYEGNAAEVVVNGYRGWISKDAIDIVPLNQAENPSNYVNRYGELSHFISDNLMSSEEYYRYPLGKSPSYLKEWEKYYNYDGKYFYTSLDLLISDLQNNTHVNAVNANDPYYNYYYYLPMRSKTSFTADQINTYISNYSASTSKLRNTGQYFIEAQNKYGVNALTMLGIAINESAWGTSYYARTKNNLFGIGAVDSSPDDAFYFESVEQCINEFAKYQMSRGYADPYNWSYNGAALGNKGFGANIQYASDPFWGEKAASNFYKVDYHVSGNGLAGLKEYDKYQLGLYVRNSKVTDETGTLLYNIGSMYSSKVGKVGTAVIINDLNKNSIGGNLSYKIQPDRTTPISNGKISGAYDWKEGYTPVNNLKLINEGKDVIKASNWIIKDGKYYYQNSDGTLAKGWMKVDGYWYYLDVNTGEMKTGLQEIGGYKYYLDASGYMRTGWVNHNGEYYFFGKDGTMKTGWINDGWTDYYLRPDGTIYKGWLDDGLNKYYMDENGQMRKGWVKYNNEYYFFGSDGAMRTGWINDGYAYYFLKSDGTVSTGWLEEAGNKYYLGTEGAMKTGWYKVDGNWYYFSKSGAMVTNQTIDGWHIGNNGIAKK